ncbi:MAG TPA: hypothetical protein VFP87_15390, partial [Chitinophagaceae bacterium]|nr:hypothetical protein [Chitinophagaceae bacterium]
GLDAVHHQAGHYLINVHSNNAEIYGYAWAMHFKKTAARRKSRTFVGSYDLEAADGDCHNLNHQKYIDGNVSLE